MFNKHLTTGHKGNSEFCFPETPNVPLGFASKKIEYEGKQNSLFPEAQSLSVFVFRPFQLQQKEKTNSVMFVTAVCFLFLLKLSVLLSLTPDSKIEKNSEKKK